MSPRFLIDTSVLIDYMKPDADAVLLAEVEQALSEGAAVSVVTTMELLGWSGHTPETRQAAEALLAALGEIALSHRVVQQVIALRSGLTIKLPDAIIAASALTEGVPLMTGNVDDFAKVPGLKLIAPGKAQ